MMMSPAAQAVRSISCAAQRSQACVRARRPVLPLPPRRAWTASRDALLVRRRASSGSSAAKADATTAAATAAAASPQQQQQQRAPLPLPPRGGGPSHLMVFVNGLSGGPSNWSYLCDTLRERLPPSIAQDMLLHRSEVNALLNTWHGIDRCGTRLADEVRALAAANPQLARVSFVAHSMGGLIARYAAGALFNPATGAVAGLRPTHFITLATPFCGCDSEGVAAVPFIEWSAPLVRDVLRSIAAPVGAILLQRTGEQFFLLDGGSGGGGGGSGGGSNDLPLLVAMTQDVPDKGLFFYSALAAFATRTCYANTDGDHLVGWANSSLRPLSALPPLPPAALANDARGVVLEDDLARAWSPAAWAQLQQPGGLAGGGNGGGTQGWHVLPQSAPSSGLASTSGDGGSSGSYDSSWETAADGGVSSNIQPIARQPMVDLANAQSSAAAEADLRVGLEAARAGSGAGAGSSSGSGGRSGFVALMLERLSALPWRRIDVSFSGAFGLAHNNIQVTRKLLNYEGRAVPRHLADQIAAMERLIAAHTAPAGGGDGGGPTAADTR